MGGTTLTRQQEQIIHDKLHGLKRPNATETTQQRSRLHKTSWYNTKLRKWRYSWIAEKKTHHDRHKPISTRWHGARILAAEQTTVSIVDWTNHCIPRFEFQSHHSRSLQEDLCTPR